MMVAQSKSADLGSHRGTPPLNPSATRHGRIAGDFLADIIKMILVCLQLPALPFHFQQTYHISYLPLIQKRLAPLLNEIQ